MKNVLDRSIEYVSAWVYVYTYTIDRLYVLICLLERRSTTVWWLDQSRIDNFRICASLVFHIFLQTAKSIVSYIFLDLRRSLPRRNTVPHGDNQGCRALPHDPCQGIKSHSPCFTDARIGFNRCEQIEIARITKSVGTVPQLLWLRATMP